MFSSTETDNLNHWTIHVEVEIEVEVNLRPTVRRPSGTRDQFVFILEISFRQLRVCYFVTPSLMRGRASYFSQIIHMLIL
jgi:hypothetical protein